MDGGAGLSEVEEKKDVMRVLVVDDSRVDRRVAQLLLMNNSCARSIDVIAVDSAQKAMEFLGQEQAIHMVLTDYCMPEMTGYDLLKAIKASSLERIPVVVMSSENEPERINQCLDAGAEDFIVKPLQSKDVQRLWDCVSKTMPKPKDCSRGEAVGKKKTMPDPPSSTVYGTELPVPMPVPSEVLHSSSVELSWYLFQLLLKLVLLVCAVLCLSELLHGWSSRGCPLS